MSISYSWEDIEDLQYLGTGSADDRLIDGSLPPRDTSLENELGFVLMHEPDGLADCIVIAIHGAAGHSRWSWSSRHEMSWLTDLLPQSMPNARIYSYGWKLQSLFGHARDLVSQLQIDANLEYNNVRLPMVFVCHNLGGAVLAEATILAASVGLDQLLNVDIVRGVVFLGVPFNGIRYKEYLKTTMYFSTGQIFQGPKGMQFPWTQIYKYIDPGSKQQADLRAKYGRLAPSWVFQLCEPPGRDEIVGKEQCQLGLPPEQEQFVKVHSISTNARFNSAEDKRYSSVLSAIYTCAYERPVFQRDLQDLGKADRLFYNELEAELYRQKYPDEAEDEDDSSVQNSVMKYLSDSDAHLGSPVDLAESTTTESRSFQSTKTSRRVVKQNLLTTTAPSAGVSEVLTDAVTGDAITQASAVSSLMPIGAQVSLGIISAGVAGSQISKAYTYHVNSKADSKAKLISAEADRQNAELAERKFLYEMQKDSYDSKSSSSRKGGSNGSDAPSIQMIRRRTNSETIQGISVDGTQISIPTVTSHNLRSSQTKLSRYDGKSTSDHALNEIETQNILRLKAELERNAAARKAQANQRNIVRNRQFKPFLQVDENKLGGRLQMILNRFSPKETVAEQVQTIYDLGKGKAKENEADSSDARSNFKPHQRKCDEDLENQSFKINMDDTANDSEAQGQPWGLPQSPMSAGKTRSSHLTSPVSARSTSASSLGSPTTNLDSSLDKLSLNISSMFDDFGYLFKKKTTGISKQQEAQPSNNKASTTVSSTPKTPSSTVTRTREDLNEFIGAPDERADSGVGSTNRRR